MLNVLYFTKVLGFHLPLVESEVLLTRPLPTDHRENFLELLIQALRDTECHAVYVSARSLVSRSLNVFSKFAKRVVQL